MRLSAVVEAVAGWSAPAPDATVYLFGSRVRGDDHAASDLDVFVDVSRVTSRAAVRWWSDNNSDGFAALHALVPFRVEILHPDDRLSALIRSAPVVEAFGNVRCVALPRVKAPGL